MFVQTFKILIKMLVNDHRRGAEFENLLQENKFITRELFSSYLRHDLHHHLFRLHNAFILHSALVDRVNKRRYANRLNALEREAVHMGIRNRVIQSVIRNNEPDQQQQLINGEIQMAQVNGCHLRPQIFDPSLEGEQQQ